MNAHAVVFKNPRQLALESLSLPEVGDEDIQIAVEYSGISTGTERLLWDGSMPSFPGMGYPLVPGYETVGRVTHAGAKARLEVGQRVFVPGANCFQGVRSLFGASASHLVTNHARVMPVDESLGSQAVLLALAATAYHAVSMGGKREKILVPDLIIGHGILGRLLARMTVAAGAAAPTVWETQACRCTGAQGYRVIHPDQDDRRDYQSIYEVSGDASILDQLILRLKPSGEIVLAGFYKEKLAFDYAPAFMREAQIRTAAEWKQPDLQAVTELVNTGRLSLNGLITHHEKPSKAKSAYEVAFGDALCLKMVLDWSSSV
jgi:3-hydroxyethyl bacteriochlorophyllide a dehydrogenase